MAEEANFLISMTDTDGRSGEGLFATLGIFGVVFGLMLVALIVV
jgi:hypothetical protein